MNPLKKIVYNKCIPFIGRMMPSKNRYCNVIYYHDIVQGEGHSFMRTNIELFKKQMQLLAENGVETLRFDDLADTEKQLFRKNRVLITFDDGWASNYSEIFEFMKSLGIKYNVFLAVGLIGNDPRYLTWDMIREMHDSGICGFGTHTYSHTDASQLDDECYTKEIVQADTIFQKELGYAPKDFCYPYGKCSTAANLRLTEESGYERIYQSNMMYSYCMNGKIIMGRNGISNDEPMSVFNGKWKGFYNIFSLIKH